MICPHCKTEMEKGQIVLSVVGELFGNVFVDWESQARSEKGLFGRPKRKKINIKNDNVGYFKDSYHCPQCHKAFVEFDTDEK